MNWDEQLSSISIGTLFKLFGKTLVAGILWVFIFYAIILIPVIAITAAIGISTGF
jgi:hypothetical protein